MKIQALQGTGMVVIKPRPDLEQTQSSRIVLPSSDDKSYIGEVINNSNEFVIGNFKYPTNLSFGDIVIYPSFGANKIKLEGKEHIFCRESELLGKIEIQN